MNNKSIIRRRRAKSKSSVLKIIIFTLISVLIIAGSFFTMFIVLYKPSVIDDPINPINRDDPLVNNNKEDEIPPVTSSGNNDSGRKKDFYTFLVMGRDYVGLNTDIIMLISFDIENESINIMQIPRDTYMKVDSTPFKINAVYAVMHNRAKYRNEKDVDDASMKDFISLLEQNLCIKIDNYALCNISGFRNIIDILGGVTMDVPYDMYYSDPEQGLYINLKKGIQTLDGSKAEQFIRYRSGYIQGDIGRIDAQKLFMSALIEQLKAEMSIGTLTSIAGEAVKNVKTSMSLADIIYFIKEFYLIKNADMNFISFPGSDTRAEITTGASYYIMHRADMMALMNLYFNVYKSEITDAQFDASRSFTNKKLPHINDIYNTVLSDDLSKYVKSAKQISEEGLDIPLL